MPRLAEYPLWGSRIVFHRGDELSAERPDLVAVRVFASLLPRQKRALFVLEIFDPSLRASFFRIPRCVSSGGPAVDAAAGGAFSSCGSRVCPSAPASGAAGVWLFFGAASSRASSWWMDLGKVATVVAAPSSNSRLRTSSACVATVSNCLRQKAACSSTISERLLAPAKLLARSKLEI